MTYFNKVLKIYFPIFSLPVIFIAAILAMFLSLAYIFPDEGGINGNELNRFKSDMELKNFLEQNSQSMGYGGFDEGIGMARTTGITKAVPATLESVDSDSGAGGNGADDFSTTNIQVEGVDEADIVKNDGKYIYAVSKDKVIIVDAYPAENMKILSEIEISGVRDIYINDDKLIVFLNSYGGGVYESDVRSLAPDEGYMPQRFLNLVYIYDISDKENPELENEIEMDGNYVNSRMIGDYVYIISTKYVNTNNPEPPVYVLEGVETKVRAEEIYYFDYPVGIATKTIKYG